MRKPNLFIVGAPKCGSTAMFRYLGRHPDVFMSPEKEPCFFASDLNDEARLRGAYLTRCADLAEYLGLFKGATTERYVGEGSVCYWTSRTAAGQIRACAPAARIIILVRDPQELLPSFHAQLRFAAMENEPDLATALALEPDRRNGRNVPCNAPCAGVLFYSDIIRFADNIARFRRAFPPEQIQLILFDDLRADPAAVFRATCRWLGIDAEVTPTFEQVNANKVPRFPLLQRLRNAPPLVRTARLLLPIRARRLILDSYRKLNRKVAPRAAIPPAVLADIRRQYRDEVAKLGAILDRDLLKLWGYDEPRADSTSRR